MKKRNVIFLICCMLYLMSYFQRSAPTVLSMDLLKDPGFTLSDLSLVSGITILSYGLMQMPAGLITDRLGARKTIIILTGIGVCSATAFAFVHTLGAALISRFILGIGVSVLIPITALACRFYPPSEAGRAISLVLAAGALGPFVSSAPLAALSTLVGWRYSLFFFAGIMFLLLVGIIFIKDNKTSPASIGSRTLADTLKGAAEILTSRRFWPLGLWMMFTSGGLFMLNTLWWGPYLMQGQGLSKIMAGNVLLASPIAMVISQPLFGWLSDVVFKNRKTPLAIATSFSVIISITFVLWKTRQSMPLLVLQTAGLTVGFVGTAPLLFALAKESFPLRVAGTALGCVNMLYPMWAFALQKIFGTILEAGLARGADYMEAYAQAGWLVVFNAVGAMLMVFLIREKSPVPETGKEKGRQRNDASGQEAA